MLNGIIYNYILCIHNTCKYDTATYNVYDIYIYVHMLTKHFVTVLSKSYKILKLIHVHAKAQLYPNSHASNALIAKRQTNEDTYGAKI